MTKTTPVALSSSTVFGTLPLAGMRTGVLIRETRDMASQERVRCLIVDDNRDFLEAASSVLQRGGIAVLGVASSIVAALQGAAELRPDVVLVDLDLGGEDGFDLAERLHRQGGPEAPAVILISTHGQQDFADLIEKSPALGFVPKTALSAAAIHSVLTDRRI
jgi:CheY-like chemotaxis protein